MKKQLGHEETARERADKLLSKNIEIVKLLEGMTTHEAVGMLESAKFFFLSQNYMESMSQKK